MSLPLTLETDANSPHSVCVGAGQTGFQKVLAKNRRSAVIRAEMRPQTGFLGLARFSQ
jgi:hypothetical protein